ncbi:MAG: alpha/beta hydrolase [Myxococcales bacterium]|nr:alpha/beta hydrolase [Myxococcales bacterium]
MSSTRRAGALRRGRWGIGSVVIGLLLGACHPALGDADQTALLWPDGAPGARGNLEADRPRLYYFLPPPELRNGTAVVVASGGSYGHHGGLSSEGVRTAKWLVSQGITAVVVRYRVHGPRRYGGLDFLADGKRAVRTVRARAEELGIDPERIGMMGFSAGGHLASNVGIRCAEDQGRADAADPIERQSCRIAFSVLIYPVITLDDRYAHRRSRRNMLGGTVPRTDALRRELSTELQVTPTTAPSFLVHSHRDHKVPDHNSVLYHEALVRNGVPSELWLFEDGGHGVGVADDPERMPQMSTWPQRCLDWMQRIGVLEPRGAGEAVESSGADGSTAVAPPVAPP